MHRIPLTIKDAEYVLEIEDFSLVSIERGVLAFCSVKANVINLNLEAGIIEGDLIVNNHRLGYPNSYHRSGVM